MLMFIFVFNSYLYSFTDLCSAEPVVDYLTRFSGLRPGDLDAAVSPHHLVTLKSAYVRLRSLVDRGICVSWLFVHDALGLACCLW